MRRAELQLKALCAYPRWDRDQAGFRQEDWDARFLTLAIKGDAARCGKGYVELRGRRYRAADIPELRRKFANWVADQTKAAKITDPVFVAIPNSNATIGAGDFSTAELTRAASARFGIGGAHYTGLRFTEVMEKAHAGGPRSAPLLVEKMTLLVPPQPGTIILVDDVCTSGGHLFAAQERLRRTGRETNMAVVAGRTVHAPEDPMIKRPNENLTFDWPR